MAFCGPYRKLKSMGLPFLLILLTVFCLRSATSAHAQWPTGVTVEHTFHNLTVPASNRSSDMAGLITNYNEVCVYCHAPHGGRTDRPLWNRPIPRGPYRMYDEDLDMIADAQPTGNSLSCLSCHDGTIGLDEIINPPNAHTGPGAAATSIEECDGCHSGGNPKGGLDFEGVWMRPDKLRDQHPISILYDPSRDPSFRTAAEIEAAGLKLFDGKVQCMTCHEPHSQRFRPFLRVNNTGQSLCQVCHRSGTGESTAHDW